MKYYVIAGEASGDLHASRLTAAIKAADTEARFRGFGGDAMRAAGVDIVKHYRELAFMGFVPVIMHLPTILSNMRMAKRDISEWQPDALILVDYPGFNLDIAKYVHSQQICPVCYYIAPKLWAWKEYRMKNIRRDVDCLLSILPFEKEFFEGRHHYPIHYVGNPTAEEVEAFREKWPAQRDAFFADNGLSPQRPIIALLCGSRRQEIRDNLPAMLRVTEPYRQSHDIVIAGAPAIERDYYERFTEGYDVKIVEKQTYGLLAEAQVALVTSGTATLETCLFGVPQVVCYETKPKWLFGFLRRNVLRVKYISLVNLVADAEVVKEYVADTFTDENIASELKVILSPEGRQAQLEGYRLVRERLGNHSAATNAATIITQLINKQQQW